MKSLRKQTFQTVSKDKTLLEVLDICEADPAKKDACFPTVQSVKNLIVEKLPGAFVVLNRRFDMVSIDDHLELARSLTEGRCHKYGIMVDNYGHTHNINKIRPFLELKEQDTEHGSEYPEKLIIDGYAPALGTGCYLMGILDNEEENLYGYSWYAFPTQAPGIKSMTQEEIVVIMTEIAILLAAKIKDARGMFVDIVHHEEMGDDNRDEHHGIGPNDSVDDIADLILPALHAAGIKLDFPRFEVRDDADNNIVFYLENNFGMF